MKDKDLEPYNFKFMAIKESQQGLKKFIQVNKYQTTKYDFFNQEKPLSKIINTSLFKNIDENK